MSLTERFRAWLHAGDKPAIPTATQPARIGHPTGLNPNQIADAVNRVFANAPGAVAVGGNNRGTISTSTVSAGRRSHVRVGDTTITTDKTGSAITIGGQNIHVTPAGVVTVNGTRVNPIDTGLRPDGHLPECWLRLTSRATYATAIDRGRPVTLRREVANRIENMLVDIIRAADADPDSLAARLQGTLSDAIHRADTAAQPHTDRKRCNDCGGTNRPGFPIAHRIGCITIADLTGITDTSKDDL